MKTNNERAVKQSGSRPNGTDTTDEPRYRDKEWLREQYVDKQQSTYEIAELCDCSDWTIRRWLKRFDIGRRRLEQYRAPADERLTDERWLREHYIDQGKSQRDIAEQLGCNHSTVGEWLKKHDIEATDKRGVPVGGRVTDGEWLREQYVNQHQTIKAIAEASGCCSATVRRKLDKHGIEVRSGGGGIESNIPDKRLGDEQWLREQYVENERSMRDISDICGCCEGVVSRWIDKHGIKTRTGNQPADKRLADADWLREQYVERTRSMPDIAEQCGCAVSTVTDWLSKHGIESRGRGSKPLSGTDHPRWNGGPVKYGRGWNKAKRRSVRERDDHTCQDPRCDVTQREHLADCDEKLHVHHLRKARNVDDPEQRNAPENLITLCRECHAQWEKMADAGLVPQGVTGDD